MFVMILVNAIRIDIVASNILICKHWYYLARTRRTSSILIIAWAWLWWSWTWSSYDDHDDDNDDHHHQVHPDNHYHCCENNLRTQETVTIILRVRCLLFVILILILIIVVIRILQGVSKKIVHSHLCFISVLEVGFYFLTCVLESEF